MINKEKGSKRNLAPMLTEASGDQPAPSRDPEEISHDQKRAKLDRPDGRKKPRKRGRSVRKTVFNSVPVERKTLFNPVPADRAVPQGQTSLDQVLLAAGLKVYDIIYPFPTT